jgi:dihydroorotate dehydrogenase
MLAAAASALTPLLRLIDAEAAHGVSLRALRWGLAGADRVPDDPALATTAFGVSFTNPLGLAAGFDKDAVAVVPLLHLGFGHVEAGTVTRRAQPGNPRPRLFRLPAQRAVINRMGFNNAGIEAFRARLAALPNRAGRIGANLGLNKDSVAPEQDYAALVAAVSPLVDYITINVSSPNTPGLRDLQDGARLRAILQAVRAHVPVTPPILIKVAPDLSDAGLEAVVEAALAGGAGGLIISNTTVERPSSLGGRHAGEAGGLSGPPVFARSTDMLRRAYDLAGDRLSLIGCGGVSSGRDALAKIRAGASLVQLYTGFTYEGPAIVSRLKRELAAALRQDGFVDVASAVGADQR